MSEQRRRHFWHLRCGHTGGEVKSVRVRSARVRMLMLYERTQPAEPATMPPLRGRLVGSMYDIRCTICGSTRDWIVGDDVLAGLEARRLERLHAARSVL